MRADVIRAIDDAIGYVGADDGSDGPAESTSVAPDDTDGPEEDEAADEEGEDIDFVDPAADKLLDRLLYRGVLPHYAFPTDVAKFA